ncbi:UNVERIFIED_CONTAM: hypothetical protein FKN15_021539 [Acipenser sinensis]
MASRKHKDTQEVFSKKVRELAKHTFNRQCCECEQPGVTYVDITVGNFVCTSCSGILRGLNPPHRVKSISMTTFSQQEVEFLQSHGNEERPQPTSSSQIHLHDNLLTAGSRVPAVPWKRGERDCG